MILILLVCVHRELLTLSIHGLGHVGVHVVPKPPKCWRGRLLILYQSCQAHPAAVRAADVESSSSGPLWLIIEQEDHMPPPSS